ncbi:hydantoinase/oxoprolinase family protein [Aquamicrobium sp. LC103]|uniref:hydantoinase/oxoprolinase family protein n=1 Tax=Aquamicrobium sp. LC103 TaxID=1120658 RepID=UPI00063E88A3|nr:hydantoinase/oxoprolinase family protein [Aquamicrobium sp. LC103]TKT69358.1 hypothetical protein XW59_027905 [Aquamicrobium sp. LC103]
MEKEKHIVAGFDIGGAHLKVTRAEGGRIVDAMTLATPLWISLDTLTNAFAEARPLYEDASLAAFTMTGELSDAFATRELGVSALLDQIAANFPAVPKLVYAGRAGFVPFEAARRHVDDVASANWHATASLVGRLTGDALFIDMGSTTTDIIPLKDGKAVGDGYTDAERLLSGELVYTGFTRTFLFGVASNAPVRGRLTPLMNEYFAAIADVHRVLGVLDETDDKHASADGKEKTVAGSIARLARMVGRDTDDLSFEEWREIAEWFSERQLRTIHDAAVLVAGKTGRGAPIVGAGTGRWQLRRLAERMKRRFVDFAEIVPAREKIRNEASSAAPASAVALLAQEAKVY